MSFLNNLGQKISDVSQTTIKKTKDLADTAKLNLNLSEEERKSDTAYEQIGKWYVEKHREDAEEDVKTWLDAIAISEARIKECRESIHQMKGVAICPSCGASDNFTHCILCDRYILPIIGFLRDKRQSDRTLSRMMCDRIRNQIDSALLRHLFHNCGLTDSRRPDQKYRTLSFHRNRILPGLIFCQVRLNRIYDFLFCLFDVHKISPLSILLYPLTNIISLPSPALLSALPKKFSAVCHPRKKQIPSDNLSVFSDILHTRP